jgi:hypothetical protein
MINLIYFVAGASLALVACYLWSKRTSHTNYSQESLQDLYAKPTADLTDEDLRRFYDADDRVLMRFSGTSHLIPVIEAFRRLRIEMHREERTIKWLTWVLVFLTAVLVLLGAPEFYRNYLASWFEQSHDAEGPYTPSAFIR